MKTTFLKSWSKLYAFFDGKYVRASLGDSVTIDGGYPLSIQAEWNFTPPFDSSLDAAIQHEETGLCYFFSGNLVCRRSRDETGPGTPDLNFGVREIASFQWQGLGAEGIDAVVQHTRVEAYVFLRNQYFTIRLDEGDLGPLTHPLKPITDFPLGDFGADGIDSVFRINDDYFLFAGNQFMRIHEGRDGFVVELSQGPTPTSSFFVEDVTQKRGSGIRYPMRNAWMSNLPAAACIYDVNLAGTHDSVAVGETWHPHLWSTQYRSVAESLDNGVRLLDIRIAVRGTAAQPDLKTCHADLTLYYDFNIYGDLSDVINVCRQFLAVNTTEFLVVSFKVDDWGPFATKNAQGQPTALPTGPPAVSQIINTMLGTLRYSGGLLSPIVEKCREHVFVLDRLERINNKANPPLGLPFLYPPNINQVILQYLPAGLTIEVQDRFKNFDWLDTFAIPQKTSVFFQALFSVAGQQHLLISFASAIRFVAAGVYLNKEIIRTILKKRPSRLGWIFFDYALYGYPVTPWGQLNCVDLVHAANWQYSTISATGLWEFSGLGPDA